MTCPTPLAVVPYAMDGFFDEAFTPEGHPRPGYETLLDALQAADLAALSDAVAARVEEIGVRFGGGEGTAFRVDPVPRVFAGDEWSLLERGIGQRLRALNAFLADVYGEQEIVREGVVPARVLLGADHFEPWMLDVAVPAGHAQIAGLDIVRDRDGVLLVLEDNLRTPSGFAYMTAARDATDATLPLEPPEDRLDCGSGFAAIGAALRAAAPDGRGDPSAVLLSDGAENSAWYEHEVLARELGIPLVTPDALGLRQGRLRAHVGDESIEVQVVYRRTDEDRLRDDHGNSTWLAELLLEPCRRGRLAVVNAFGSGVGDDKLVHAYVEEMVRFYLGEEPAIGSVRTYDLAESDVRAAALERVDELVVKPRTGHGGHGLVVGPHAQDLDRARISRAVRAHPDDFVAQETVWISRHPTVCNGRLEPRHVDLRAFAISHGDGVSVVPGGLSRVALSPGALVVNSSQNGGGKDTWALGR